MKHLKAFILLLLDCPKTDKDIFVFDKSSQTITGIQPKYQDYFKTLAAIAFPDTIEGVEVEHIDNRNIFDNTHDNPNTHILIIHLPKNLKSIGNGAFYYCTNLTSITISNSVKSIGKEAFEGCTKLTSINIPKSITNIKPEAFKGCTKLTVTIEQTNPIQIRLVSNAFDDVQQIKVSKNRLKYYKWRWSEWKDKIIGY